MICCSPTEAYVGAGAVLCSSSFFPPASQSGRGSGCAESAGHKNDPSPPKKECWPQEQQLAASCAIISCMLVGGGEEEELYDVCFCGALPSSLHVGPQNFTPLSNPALTACFAGTHGQFGKTLGKPRVHESGLAPSKLRHFKDCAQTVHDTRRWIFSLPVAGELTLDDGAARVSWLSLSPGLL